jgi:hypothetical protein
MNVFVPYPDMVKCAKALDYKRLGKQRVECWQILTSVNGWVNHPARKAWEHHLEALRAFGGIFCREWADRGYRDNMAHRFFSEGSAVLPGWWGYEPIHESHRRSLASKDPEYYGKQWNDSSIYGYIWPKWNGTAWTLTRIEAGIRIPVGILEASRDQTL